MLYISEDILAQLSYVFVVAYKFTGCRVAFACIWVYMRTRARKPSSPNCRSDPYQTP
jgi:hypothetical protein